MAEQHVAEAVDPKALRAARLFQAASLIIAAVSFGLLALQATDFRDDVVTIGRRYYSGILSVTLLLLLCHILVVRIIALIQSSATNAEAVLWYKAYFNPLRLADVVCGSVAVVATITCFTVYKTNVVGSQGYHLDALFIAWDRAIFGGTDPWRVTHWLLPSAVFTKWIDFLYHPTFLALLISYMACVVLQARPALRYTFMLSYLASFVLLGMVMAFHLSAAGPIFDGVFFGDGSIFDPLSDALNAQNEVAGPFVSLIGKEYLLRLNAAGVSAAAGGISAMPSMHVLLAFLCAVGLLHANRILGALATLYAAIIWLGSVHLGWHYFVDGLVSLIALALIWTIIGRVMGLYGQAQVIRATT